MGHVRIVKGEDGILLESKRALLFDERHLLNWKGLLLKSGEVGWCVDAGVKRQLMLEGLLILGQNYLLLLTDGFLLSFIE